MDKFAGGFENIYEFIVELSQKLQNLIRKTCNQGKQNKFYRDIDKKPQHPVLNVFDYGYVSKYRPVCRGNYYYVYKQYYKQKGRAASVVQARTFRNLFGRKLYAVFVSVYRLMLRPVVHIQPAYIFKQKHQRKIRNKYNKLKDAQKHVIRPMVFAYAGNKPYDKPRQKDKNAYCENYAQTRRYYGDYVHKVYLKLFGKPFLYSARFFFRIAVHRGGTHKYFSAAHQRQHKVDYTAYERYFARP